MMNVMAKSRWSVVRLLLGVLWAVVYLHAPQVHSEDAENAMKEMARLKLLTAYLVRCEADTAHVQVTSPDGQTFADEYGDFGKMLRTLRHIIPGHCASARNIKIVGVVENELWYAGATSVADNWVFTSLFAPPPSAK